MNKKQQKVSAKDEPASGSKGSIASQVQYINHLWKIYGFMCGNLIAERKVIFLLWKLKVLFYWKNSTTSESANVKYIPTAFSKKLWNKTQVLCLLFKQKNLERERKWTGDCIMTLRKSLFSEF